MALFILAVTLLNPRSNCRFFKQFCLPSLWMIDNCKTFSVSRIIHFHVIFHFNGFESFEISLFFEIILDGNLQWALNPRWHYKVEGKATVLSLQIYNHTHNQFFIESESTKITWMSWNQLDIFPSRYRISPPQNLKMQTFGVFKNECAVSLLNICWNIYFTFLENIFCSRLCDSFQSLESF